MENFIVRFIVLQFFLSLWSYYTYHSATLIFPLYISWKSFQICRDCSLVHTYTHWQSHTCISVQYPPYMLVMLDLWFTCQETFGVYSMVHSKTSKSMHSLHSCCMQGPGEIKLLETWAHVPWGNLAQVGAWWQNRALAAEKGRPSVQGSHGHGQITWTDLGSHPGICDLLTETLGKSLISLSWCRRDVVVPRNAATHNHWRNGYSRVVLEVH